MFVSGDPEGIADIQAVAVAATAAVVAVPPRGLSGDVGEQALADILGHVLDSYADAAVRLAAEAEQVGVYAVGVAGGIQRADGGPTR